MCIHVRTSLCSLGSYHPIYVCHCLHKYGSCLRDGWLKAPVSEIHKTHEHALLPL